MAISDHFYTSQQLVRELRYADKTFFESPAVTKQDLRFIYQLIVVPSEQLKEAHRNPELSLNTKRIFKLLEDYHLPSRFSRLRSIPLSFARSPEDDEVLMMKQAVRTKFASERFLPDEILTQILAMKADSLGCYEVLAKEPASCAEMCWQNIARQIGCPLASHLEVPVKAFVKKYIAHYKAYIKRRAILPPEITKILQTRTTLDSFLSLRKWKALRDTYMMGDSLSDNFGTAHSFDLVVLRDYSKTLAMANQFSEKFRRRFLDQPKVRLNLGFFGLSTLPKVLAEVALVELILGPNDFAELPDWIGDLNALTKLGLNSNKLVRLPDSMRHLTALTELSLSYNKQLGQLPRWIGNLSSLTSLSLEMNQLHSLPESMQYLRRLEILSLNDNPLKQIPDWIGSFGRLKCLTLRSTKITGLPDSMRRLTNLESLSLSSNDLQQLPEWIGDLRELRTIQVWENQLIRLPASMRQLSKLESLQAYDNPGEMFDGRLENYIHLVRQIGE